MLTSQTIYRIIDEFRASWVPTLVKRLIQVDLLPGKITSIYGPRRAGKTYLLYQLAWEAEEQGLPRTRILYVNFEDERLLPMDAQDMGRIVDTFLASIPMEQGAPLPLLLMDEVQSVEGWPLVMRRLADSGACHVVVTGSSSVLMSKEIATSLRGRVLSHELAPFCLEEIAALRGLDPWSMTTRSVLAMQKLLDEYLTWGGYPEVWVKGVSDRVRRKILQEYFELTFYRDIVDRHDVRNSVLLKRLLKYIATNAGSLFSVNRFHGHLKQLGLKASKDTIHTYLDHAKEASLLFEVSKQAQSIKEQLVNPSKVYFNDTGMRNAISPPGHDDRGRMLEHLVFLELRRRGYECYYSKQGGECDFVAFMDGRAELAVQVVSTLDNQNVLTRELAGLASAKKLFPEVSTVLVAGEILLPQGEHSSSLVHARDWLIERHPERRVTTPRPL